MSGLSDETREELIVAVLRQITSVTNLPDWMQVPALGRDVRPLAELVVDAQADALAPLIHQAEARALRDAAADLRGHAAMVWGGSAQWLTTGSHVANLAADWVTDLADDHAALTTEGER